MHPRLRLLLLAAGALFLGAGTAAAQFIELITEADVTITAELTIAPPPGSNNKPVTLKIPQAAFLDQLVTEGVIPTADKTGWRLVTVRSAPADLTFVDASLNFYVVNPTYPNAQGTRIPIAGNKLSAAGYGTVEKYVERHQGQYIHSSKGTVTNHTRVSYFPKFQIGDKKYAMSTSRTEGFATLSYASKELYSDPKNNIRYEVFFYGISSIRLSARGGFTIVPPIVADPTAPTQGLLKTTLDVGAARLVPRSNYPEVNFYP